MREARRDCRLGFLAFTFTSLLHKVQDGNGPVRPSQEPRDALHHPLYLIFFFRSHPNPRGAPQNLRPDPQSLLRPFGRKEHRLWGEGEKKLAPLSPRQLGESRKPVNVKWSLWQHAQPPGSEACFPGAYALYRGAFGERFRLAGKEQ